MHVRSADVKLDLDLAATKIFAAVGARDWELRWSSNYLDDRYLRALVEGFWVCIAMSDEVLEGYPIMLWVEMSPDAQRSDRINFESRLVAKVRSAGLQISQ